MDLKESQELFKGCDFISKKTRSIYAWRTALWVRFCNERKEGFQVTEDKLIEYLDWLFEIDLVNKINTKKNYVPDILRDHMGSVICLWRIQTGDNSDLVSPKEGTRYQAKWDDILRAYPRRERFLTRPHIIEGRGINAATGKATPETSPRMHTSYQPNYNRDIGGSGGHRFHPHYPGHQQNIPPQRQQLVIAPYQHSQHSLQLHGRRPLTQPHNMRTQQLQQHQQQQYQTQLAGVAEPTEHCWQLRWMLSESWAPVASRLLFTLAMSTWVEAACVVGLQLSDVHFASSTMAPRLPPSVLRISLVVPQASSARHGPGGPGPASFTARQQFSIIRSRSPLLCSWNALAVALFYRWHIAGASPPTFANSQWQSTLAVPANLGGYMSPSMASDGGQQDSRMAIAAIESRLISATERLSLVRELLPRDRLPVERIVRQHSLQRALSQSLHRAQGGIAQQDSQAAYNDFTPLADGGSPDRLSQLRTANSGYFAHHHMIQRHNVIPPEALQRTDLAVLRCCNAPILHEADAASILGSQLFSTPDFARYCEMMKVEAAEEISLLRHDLDLAMSNGEHYGDVSRGTDIALYGTGQPMQHLNGLSGQGTTLPPMLSQRRIGGSMMPDSPDRESFSPTISPSPPVQDPRSSSLNPAPYIEDPHSINIQQQHTPLMANQQVQSHSLPTRPLDGWSDSYFNHGGSSNGTPGGFGAAGPSTASGSQGHSAKRRRPEVSSGLVSPSAIAMPRSNSPYNRVPSPKSNWQSSHSQRLSRSPPRPMRSPLGGNTGNSSYRVGPPPSYVAGTTTLPSISQFVQPASDALPLPIGSPSLGRVATHDQLLRSGAMHRRDAANHHFPPSSLRRSSGSIGEESSIGGIGDTTVTGRDELSRSEQDQITFLREENAYLKQRLHQLEISVSQRQAEVENRMARMEQYMTRTNERTL
ncbi:hypothetical protein GGI17_003168 [Coemansia sp. S146]|nr:hypothetical protein GGI17_003168 [Coemansia sp. S146]